MDYQQKSNVSITLIIAAIFGPYVVLGKISEMAGAETFTESSTLDEPRSAIPDEAELKKTSKELESKYNLNFRRVSANQKNSFAQRLQILVAGETDSTARYVLLTNALENASEAGEIDLSMRLADMLCSEFMVSPHQAKRDALKAISRVRRDPDSCYQLALLSNQLAWSALDEHMYSDAVENIQFSISFANRTRSSTLLTQLRTLNELLENWEEEYASVDKAHHAIMAGNETREDQFAWGQFLCFVRQDWEAGLPLLMKGGDGEISKLAEAELNNPEEFQSVIDLSKKWAVLSQDAPEKYRIAIQEHATELVISAGDSTNDSERALVYQYSRELFGMSNIWDTKSATDGLPLGGERANLPEQATLEFWIRTNDLQGGCLFKKSLNQDETLGIDIEGGNARLILKGPAFFKSVPGTISVSDGNWHHVAATRAGKSFRLFVNGRAAADFQIQDNHPLPNASPWLLGVASWDPKLQLSAQFSKIRVSSVIRYHTRFIPSKEYASDGDTLMLK